MAGLCFCDPAPTRARTIVATGIVPVPFAMPGDASAHMIVHILTMRDVLAGATMASWLAGVAQARPQLHAD